MGKKSFFIVAILLILPFFGLRTLQQRWYRGYIPEGIHIGRPISVSVRGHLFGGCGAIVFRLKRSSLSEIKYEGIDFFDDINHPRVQSKSEYRHEPNPLRYQPWKESPMPTRGGSHPGLMCSRASRRFKRKIINAIKSEGSFYTSGDRSNIKLVVIPFHKLVVFLFFD